MATNVPRLRSSATGVGWPAIPSYHDAAILALVDQLGESEWWPADMLLAYQIRQLEQVIAHATRTVPFYRGRLTALDGLKKGELTIEMWRQLPVLTRREVLEAGSQLESRRLPDDHGTPVEVTTSGSTGQPVKIKATPVTGLFFSALHLRYHRWHRRDLSATVANFGRPERTQVELARTGAVVPWAPVYRSGRMYFLDFFRTPIAEQLAWLARMKPRYLLTYPSNLRMLLEASSARGFTPSGLAEVSCQSEALDADLRTLCARHWGVKLVDCYSSNEVGLIGVQCPDHPHYHIQSESLFVEVLDDNNRPCPAGAVGRVVVTDLHNFATPLIRYELGDWAEVGAACACGRGLPVIARVLGRTRNRFILPSGEPLWPTFNPIFVEGLGEAFRSFRQGQLVQKSRHEIEVRVVLGTPATPAEEDAARTALGQVLSPEFTYRFVYVDAIPRPRSGKIDPLISEVEAGSPPV